MVTTYAQIKLIALIVISILLITACNNQPKEKKFGQALVSINGQEVTTLQLNDEIRRSGVHADQYELVSKQLLESLIARQLIVDEAIRNKIDRTPEVMRARERASAQIIAQAYLQSIVNKIAKPSKDEVNEYFQKHPEYFSQRKQFDLTVLRIATKDFGSELRVIIDADKSINDVIAWLDKKNVQYFRNSMLRSTSDLPSQVVGIMQEKGKDRVIVINEQENSFLISVNAIKNNPITFEVAVPKIERYLINQKYKQATDAEIDRLRALAKIEYFNVKTQESNNIEKTEQFATPSIEIESNPRNNNFLSESVPEGAIERGMMGLK